MTMDNGFTNVVYDQTESNQTYSINAITNFNLEDIPMEKAQVGDIEMAYKMFGKGDPIILHNGASDGMTAWPQALLS